MARKRASRRRYTGTKRSVFITSVFTGALLMVGTGLGIIQYVLASDGEPTALDIDPNFGIKNQVIEFFEANKAAEMVPIVKCESRFRHYDRDGNVLMNKAGSSATGVTQILASVHPDPRIIERHNRKYDIGLSVDDFDITTLEGNLGYALVLYQVNGTRDWECSKRFYF